MSRGASRAGTSTSMLEIHEVDENAPERSEEEEAKAEEERKALELKKLQEMNMKSETRESLLSEVRFLVVFIFFLVTIEEMVTDRTRESLFSEVRLFAWFELV